MVDTKHSSASSWSSREVPTGSGRSTQSSRSVEPGSSFENYEAANPITLTFWLKATLFFFVLSLGSRLVYRPCMPTTTVDRPSPHSFIGTNARRHLQKVTFLGPRTIGSIANEVFSPEYLLTELHSIAQLGASNGLNVFVDEQLASASSFRYHYGVQNYKNIRNLLIRFHNSSLSENTNHSAFLVNCHYDTFVGSPGATDTFVNCAILLEAGRAIATGNVRLTNDLIFLFNGAEEGGLLSSHAFVTQHQWASSVKAFMNLEGTGAGGRLLVFQSMPDESSSLLLGTYESCFHYPYADVFGEEIFQSGLIPSDTDFRIFRDFGLMPGLDLAYVRDGYAYHTPFDTETRISAECLQQNGEEIMRFLSTIAEDSRLKSVTKLKPVNQSSFSTSPSECPLNELMSTQVSRSQLPLPLIEISVQDRHVYFDVLGVKLFVVTWSRWKFFNWLISLFVFCRLCYLRGSNPSRWVGLGTSLVLQCVSQIFGFMLSLLLGFIVHTFGFRMSWYSNQYNVVGLYIVPLICWFIYYSTCFFRMLYKHCSFWRKICTCSQWCSGSGSNQRFNYTLIEADFFDSATLLLTVLISTLTVLNRPAVFLFTLWLTATMLGRLTYESVFHHSRFPLSKFLVTVMPALVLWHLYFCTTLLEILIPVFGRSGHVVRQDVLISAYAFFCLAPVALFILGPLHCTSNSSGKVLRLIFLNACVTYAVLVHSSSYGFPYTVPTSETVDDPTLSPRFQRISVLHVDRTFHGEFEANQVANHESFITIVAWDSNGVRFLKPQTGLRFLDFAEKEKPNGLVELQDAVAASCNFSLPYCGIPFFFPLFHMFTEFYHIPVKPHGSQPVAQISLLSRVPLANSQLRNGRIGWNYTFSLKSGPPQTPLALRFEVPHVRLLNWSFAAGTAVPVPVPLAKSSSAPHFNSDGAHYFINFVNAAAFNSSSLDPWIFWLTIDRPLELESSHFDLAVMGMYFDKRLPSGSSTQLDDILSRLPPWVSVSTGCASYDHYRVPLS